MTKTSIQSWTELEMQDLFYAYRKAKADNFFERSLGLGKEFVSYEMELPAHLSTLLTRLSAGDLDAVLNENLGTPRLVAKKLGLKEKPHKAERSREHSYFSDPSRAFTHLTQTHYLHPEFRLVGNFPVTMHVLSALWINLVGHKFDAALSKCAYGSRLRRYRPDFSGSRNNVGEYHIKSIGSFQPYFDPYRRWREGGMQAIRSELVAERPVIALSMDLTSYYHHIDPSFMVNPEFLSSCEISLTSWELEFTRSFVQVLTSWSVQAAASLAEMGAVPPSNRLVGIPIGLSIVRIISNVLLLELDRDILQGLAPVYYGRYVDDLFLVIHDPGHLTDPRSLLKFIADRVRCFPPKANKRGEMFLTLPGNHQGKTKLLLQQAKQKIFFLKGIGGLDLLDSIESQIRSVSSERRLMPSPDRLESMASAKVLAAAGHPSEEADTLRRADGLAVRRLGWAVQLRAVETLAKDLRQDDWRGERLRFYEFAHSHILRPDKILDHIDYLPRLLSLAVALMDWPEAKRLVEATLTALVALREATGNNSITISGIEISSASSIVWTAIRQSVLEVAQDTLLRSMRWDRREGKTRSPPETAVALCMLVGLGNDESDISRLSLLFREADWAKTSYKDHLRRDAWRRRPSVGDEEVLHGLYEEEQDLREFLSLSDGQEREGSAERVSTRCGQEYTDVSAASLLPFLFPTRPYTTQEISLFLPESCIFASKQQGPGRAWARYVRAVRGVWVLASSTSSGYDATPPQDPPPGRKIAFLNGHATSKKVRLGISSLLTTEDSWKQSASGHSDLSPARYARIERLVNQAISTYPRPTHLLLPELALPERWIDTVSSLLRHADISLIAGLDYHHSSPNLVHSSALLVLADRRLGFRASVELRQDKSLPAPAEEETLLKIYGKVWGARRPNDQKAVYAHQDFCFGVLMCSELQNMEHRLRFQGDVDCVIVLSWNQDLDTFSALVEAASLDVHANIALVNNRRFGDSRVRSPAKEHYERDVCRLRGGMNEHVVVVEIDAHKLRAFQSRATRWPGKNDPYKPVPEGFILAGFRKTDPA
jgi:hypothetical protein